MPAQLRNKQLFHGLIVAFLDLIIICVAYGGSLWARFEFHFSDIDPVFIQALGRFLPVCAIITLGIFYFFRMYHIIWHYVGVNEVGKMILAVCLSSVVCDIISLLMNWRLPISVYLMAFLLQFVLHIGMRYSLRILTLFSRKFNREKSGTRTMIIGAGAAGRMLLRELQSSTHCTHAVPICIIDDDPSNTGRLLEGVPIVGNRDEIPRAAERYNIQQIVFAIPTATTQQRKDILNICKETGCALKIVPGLYQLLNGEVKIQRLRDVQVEDLLGREPVKVNLEEMLDELCGKTILVTGAGGSIGSELCRQIARHRPGKLVMLDVYENNVYDIQQELLRFYSSLNLEVVIASVRDMPRLEQIFSTYHPDIVYHAAAHKHVPLMEDSPNEAIKNNVFGTYQVAQCASKYNAKKMVLISTDKAVNPTNIMGASKRLCEMVIQAMNRESKTDYVAVRFGNVLGSNGSVIPLFRRQIEEGGPVTVTHPDIIRYFMTIPEAVSLVLQAGFYAKGGEIFILDMRDPVRIDDLARNLIRLSGLEPGVDIEIKYTGLRPGEKLYEEMLMAEEGLQETPNELIHIGKPIEMDETRFQEDLKRLHDAAFHNSGAIKQIVAEIVPTYHPQ